MTNIISLEEFNKNSSVKYNSLQRIYSSIYNIDVSVYYDVTEYNFNFDVMRKVNDLSFFYKDKFIIYDITHPVFNQEEYLIFGYILTQFNFDKIPRIINLKAFT